MYLIYLKQKKTKKFLTWNEKLDSSFTTTFVLKQNNTC